MARYFYLATARTGASDYTALAVKERFRARYEAGFRVPAERHYYSGIPEHEVEEGFCPDFIVPDRTERAGLVKKG